MMHQALQVVASHTRVNDVYKFKLAIEVLCFTLICCLMIFGLVIAPAIA